MISISVSISISISISFVAPGPSACFVVEFAAHVGGVATSAQFYAAVSRSKYPSSRRTLHPARIRSHSHSFPDNSGRSELPSRLTVLFPIDHHLQCVDIQSQRV